MKRIKLTDWETVKKDLNLKDDEMDSHETDLYVISTPKTKEYFKTKKHSFTCFASEIDGVIWLDIPFYLIDDRINKHKRK